MLGLLDGVCIVWFRFRKVRIALLMYRIFRLLVSWVGIVHLALFVSATDSGFQWDPRPVVGFVLGCLS